MKKSQKITAKNVEAAKHSEAIYLESSTDMTVRCGRCGDRIGMSTGKRLIHAIFWMTVFRNRHRNCR